MVNHGNYHFEQLTTRIENGFEENFALVIHRAKSKYLLEIELWLDTIMQLFFFFLFCNFVSLLSF